MTIESEKAEAFEMAIGEKADVGRSQLVDLAFRDWRSMIERRAFSDFAKPPGWSAAGGR